MSRRIDHSLFEGFLVGGVEFLARLVFKITDQRFEGLGVGGVGVISDLDPARIFPQTCGASQASGRASALRSEQNPCTPARPVG